MRPFVSVAIRIVCGAFASGCNAMAGATVPIDADADADAARGPDAQEVGRSIPDSLDASSPVDAGEPLPRDSAVEPSEASVCSQLTLLLRFDRGSLSSAQGHAPTRA